MDCIGIIPARYGSTRFRGKALAMIGDKPMIQHVCERASQAVEQLWVATDSRLIAEAVERFGGRAVMTSPDAPNGTARCAEALDAIGCADDTVVVNIQGDEPFINPSDIRAAVACFTDPGVEISTLARRFDISEGFDTLSSPDNPKVVMDRNMNALYFSRSVIPYVRGYNCSEWLDRHTFHIHIGLYAYRAATLRLLSRLPESSLDRAEKLEQLRWLEAGHRIRVALTHSRTVSVDTPGDLQQAIEYARTTGLI